MRKAITTFVLSFLCFSVLGVFYLLNSSQAEVYPSFEEAMGDEAPEFDPREPLASITERQRDKLAAGAGYRTQAQAEAADATADDSEELRAELPAQGDEVLLPDLRTLTPSDLSVIGSRSEGTLRLKFTNTIWNAGPGPLEVRGARNAESDTLEVYQYAYTGGEESTTEQIAWVGTFDYSHRHGHLHFDEFAQYDLWSLDESGELDEVVASNGKVGFCLMDIMVIDEALGGEEDSGVYAGCREDIQGISVGWGDEYLAALYEQDINVSHVPDGSYALVSTVNPDFTVQEAEVDNNAVTVYLEFENDQVVSVRAE